MEIRAFYTRAALACCYLLLAGAACHARPPAWPAAGDAERIDWQPVDQAQLKMDDKIPLAWNVYQPAKKDKKKDSNLVLVLLGRRYLMLDIKARLVYAVFPSDLQAQGKDFESGDLAQQSRLVPSTDWSERDIGPLESIRLTLGDYGRALEVQLPHPLDIRLGIY